MSQILPHTISSPPRVHAPADSALTVSLARHPEDIQAGQRLRYTVFVEEMGVQVPITTPGLEQDAFDRHCQHLLVRDHSTQQVVGYTRLLSPEGAYQAGGYYSQGEFQLDALLATPGRFAELGRTCIHPDYRNGSTISTLWSGVAEVIAAQRIDYLIGCASVHLGDHFADIHALYRQLAERCLVNPDQRILPKLRVPEDHQPPLGQIRLPPLFKAYLRMGALIGGEPCLDPAFHVADFFIFLPTKKVERRYARHFMDRHDA